ncbi:MAG: hypothetical protein M3174_00495 [Actinomycetota bacterium]|nr:hypothetical protein [Actinomycetota bacterium]
MAKLGFLVGFGAGYVLGAKAGTERYEQLKRLYDNLAASPAVQKATGKAKTAASSGVSTVKEKASEGASKVTDSVKNRSNGDDSRPGGLTVAPPPSG